MKNLQIQTARTATNLNKPKTWAYFTDDYISRAFDRPVLTHGIQSGDIGADTGIVWARADRPSRLRIEVASTDSFKEILQQHYVDALPESDRKQADELWSR